MFWLIQENTAKEERYQDLIDAVERSGTPYKIIKVIPFSHELEPSIDPPKPVMVYGSMTLTQRIAPRNGWTVFTNENFDYRVCNAQWAGHMLNEDAFVGSFRDVELPEDDVEFFIRPILDNKAFSGMIMDKRDYQNWLGRLFMNEQASDLDFTLDEIVMVAPLKRIQKEIRFFIVDGKIVTHSTYKLGHSVVYYDESMTDDSAIDFVNDMLDIWQPHKAFVLDVALVDNLWKIIEINCINSSGLYKSDTYKLVAALLDDELYK